MTLLGICKRQAKIRIIISYSYDLQYVMDNKVIINFSKQSA